jgi:diamine N-acetyltransferase
LKSPAENTPSLNYRVAEPAEMEALAAFAQTQFAANFAHLYEAAEMQRFLEDAYHPDLLRREMSEGKAVFALCETSGHYLGYIKYGFCKLPITPANPPQTEIHQLYIDAGMQGYGIGKKLMQMALADMEPRSGEICLGVWSQNFRAQRFYESFGFAKVGEYDFIVGKHADREFIYRKIGAKR